MSFQFSCRIQTEDFSISAEYEAVRKDSCGALVLFSGLVRDQFDHQDGPLQALELEHYPGMTENAIASIAERAAARFDLRAITVIHRVGRLGCGEQIVLVTVTAPHRSDAFAACEMLMDFLKNQVPIWKKAHFAQATEWVEAKSSDKEALNRWGKVTG
jgi:molybdopterin synthase catalytic subunit